MTGVEVFLLTDARARSFVQAAEGEEGVLEQQNRELQQRVVNLEREVARWSNVNNGLYRFCVTQLLAAPTQDHSVKQPQEPHHH
jgi:hypothetical protein